MITAQQLRMAKAALGWSFDEWAKKTNLSVLGLRNIHNGTSKPQDKTLDNIIQVFEHHGIEFLPYEGVRRVPRSTVIELEGHDGFVELMKMVLKAAETPDVDICVSGVDERLFDAQTGDFIPIYLKKITDLHREHNFNFRIIVEENDNYEVGSDYAAYRRLPSDYFTPSPVYIFGDHVAFIEFDEGNGYIWLINSQQLANAQRKQFNLIWEKLSQ